MSALTIQWNDAGREKTTTIYEQQPSKNPGTVRIGRDPLRCDIVMSNITVSGLHIEIFFNQQQQKFLIRNLREKNPPFIDGRQLVQGELPLNEGSIIFLGQAQIKVIAVFISEASSVPATVLSPPPQLVNQSPSGKSLAHNHQGMHGLQCPKCHKVSSMEHLQVGCPWCGTSLAAAASVVVEPNN